MMQQEISEYIAAQRNNIDKNNRTEFVECIDQEDEAIFSSARTNPSFIDRNKHMKTAVIDNQDRLLSRSVIFESEDKKYFNAAEERVRNLETHFGIIIAPADKSLYERIKVLEDKMLKIEQHYPQIAAHCFNYGKAEKMASTKPGGRVSRFEAVEGISKKNKKPSGKSDKAKEASLLELQEKMTQLKKKLTAKK